MLQAACHCGAVRLEIAHEPVELTDCNCSICRRVGALWAYYTHRTARVVTEPGEMSVYVWGDRTVEFFHCNTCGCVTHHERADKSRDSTLAVNARMMDSEATASARVRHFDGALTWKYVD